MSARRPWHFGLWSAVLCSAGAVLAGEIIILQPSPAPPASAAREEARRAAGKPVASPPTILQIDPATGTATTRLLEPLPPAERAAREAREFLDPPSAYHDETTVILRAAPPSEAEKARLRARSALTPTKPVAVTPGKSCTATSDIGTIGEGAGAARGNVSERGITSVTSSCR